jgi:chemotaxis protein MotB
MEARRSPVPQPQPEAPSAPSRYALPPQNKPADPIPVYLRSRPRVEHVRHGGAWKIAYADFVTALMCLFIVMWLMNSTNPVKKSISGYFRDPKGFSATMGAGPANSGEGLRADAASLKQIRERLQSAMQQAPELQKLRDNVAFSVTGEGLRIDLMESEKGTFFITSSPNPTAAGENILNVLTGEISQLPNRVILEGHSDSSQFRNAGPSTGYSNWELSADRANAARRLMHSFGLAPDRVVEVRGFADQQLLNPADPTDPRNRRISIVIKFQ